MNTNQIKKSQTYMLVLLFLFSAILSVNIGAVVEDECDCLIPNPDIDKTRETPLEESAPKELSLYDVLSANTDDSDIQTLLSDPDNLVDEQTQIQYWDIEPCMEYALIHFEYIGKESGRTNAFGYWLDDPEGFIPLFKDGSETFNGIPLPDFSPGDSTDIILTSDPAHERLGFGILSTNDSETITSYFSLNDANKNTEDHVLIFELQPYTKYLLCFEDYSRNHPYGNDFDDFIVLMTIDCNPDEPIYKLTISTDGDGDANPETGYYLAGSIISLLATPANGWLFSHWEGDNNESENPVSLHMTENITLTAVFVPDEEEDDEEDEPSVKTTSHKKSTIPKNRAPIADPSGPYEGLMGEAITLDGSNSSDPDNDPIVLYKWNMGNGDIRYGETISYTYDSAYEYFVTLTVYDRSYLSGSAHTIVTVIQPNRAPETPLISGLTDLFTSAEYSFLAHSDDADNDDIEYIFDWDDGTESTSGPLSLPGGQAYNALHAWDEPGDYTITVTVSDGDLSSSEDFEITVTQPVQTTNIAIVLLAIILIAALLIVYFTRKNNE